ncbi:MAG: beta-lactamase family protein [Desulforhopalus sp.]|nr:beta-lactamase family protein [Desulforhopalus sp.]
MKKSTVKLFFNVLDKYCREGVFTNCATGWFKRGEEGSETGFFYCRKEGDTCRCTVRELEGEESFFDLASLTKVLVTIPVLLLLAKAGKINFEQPIVDFYPKTPSPLAEVTLFQLMNHSSGLPAHRSYYSSLINVAEEERFEVVVQSILAERVEAGPDEKKIYSDLGYILLGSIIEKVTGKGLEEFWQQALQIPCGLEKSLFFGDEMRRKGIIPVSTGLSGGQGEELVGRVHDDNCRILGGVAGHAGLFGNCRGVLDMAQLFYNEYHGEGNMLPGKLFQESVNRKFGERRCGFDIPTGRTSSSGHLFSPLTIGHLGFTGTSMWIDLQRGAGIVLLTNRVYCGEDLSGIRRMRPEIHDILMKALV